LISQN